MIPTDKNPKQKFLLQDCWVADTFALSYREYLNLKPTHYRWSEVAPAAVITMAKALQGKWSLEKLAEHLLTTVEEAQVFYRRYLMSKQVNTKEGGAEKIKQAFFAWSSRFEHLGENERLEIAKELALLTANQLFAIVKNQEDLDLVIEKLEGIESKGNNKDTLEDSGPPKSWGPQWKD